MKNVKVANVLKFAEAGGVRGKNLVLSIAMRLRIFIESANRYLKKVLAKLQVSI